MSDNDTGHEDYRFDCLTDEVTRLQSDRDNWEQTCKRESSRLLDAYSELARLESETEALQGRVAEHEEELALFISVAVLICQQESDEWDSDSLQTHKDYAEVCGERVARLSPINASAWLLRKQAEAVEGFGNVFDRMHAMVASRKVAEDAYAYAEKLKQQATDAEKAGNES